MPGVWKPCGYRPFVLLRIVGRIVEEGDGRVVLVAVPDAQVPQVIEVGPHLQRVVALEQRQVVAELIDHPVGLRARVAAGAGVDRRERDARREDVHRREVARVVLAGDVAHDVGEVHHPVHLAGDLVQPAAAEDEAVLAHRAPRVDDHVVGLPVVVVRAVGHRVLVLVLTRVAEHHGLRVIELQIRFQRVGPERARQRCRSADACRTPTPRESGHGACAVDEHFELVVLVRRNERARVFQHLLDRAEEEHPVLDDRAADRSAELLPAEWRLLTVGLLLEVVLPGQALVAFVPEDRAVHDVRARLRHE